MVAASTVSPGEVMNWNGQRADARQNLMATKAQTLYQRQLGDLQYSRNLKDMGRQFDQQRVGIPTQFARQGTLRSGLYQRALQNYGLDRLGALNGLQLAHMGGQGGLVLQDRGAEDQYASALQRILGEQYARQAQQAAGIGGWI